MKEAGIISYLLVLFCSFLFVQCDSDYPYKPKQFVTPEPKSAFIAKSDLASLIGKTDAKIVYTLEYQGRRTIYYVDFNDETPTAKKLKKPEGKELYHADSPLLSPDGEWVTYWMVKGGDNEVYVQKLDPDATPKLISDPGGDPHWWEDSSGNLYVVFASTGEFLIGDITSVQDGWTKRQQVNKTDPTQMIGTAETLAPYPFRGGLSKDGRYLCTGYELAYFYDITNSLLVPISGGSQICNPSIRPHTDSTDIMMFLNLQGYQKMNGFDSTLWIDQHQMIFTVDVSNTVLKYFDHTQFFATSKKQWQDPEWSNDPGYFSALAQDAGNDNWDCYIVRYSDGAYKTFNDPSEMSLNETSTPFIWINQN
ncbi:MAG: hypothetical protein GF350_01340 [Chitinivibrionales bacterium]|nr:hypothetical protein [Chitinivibrionales bacterium]